MRDDLLQSNETAPGGAVMSGNTTNPAVQGSNKSVWQPCHTGMAYGHHDCCDWHTACSSILLHFEAYVSPEASPLAAAGRGAIALPVSRRCNRETAPRVSGHGARNPRRDAETLASSPGATDDGKSDGRPSDGGLRGSARMGWGHGCRHRKPQDLRGAQR